MAEITPLMQERAERLKAAQSENERLLIAKRLFELIENNTESITDKMDDGVAISNFDEVEASLHNEFSRNIKVLKQLLTAVKVSSQDQAKIVQAIEKGQQKATEDQFQTIRIKKPKGDMRVSNLEEIRFPDGFNVQNLSDLEGYFKELQKVIQDTFNVKIPTPVVRVDAPIVNVPEMKMPDFDLSQLAERLKSINQSLVKVKNNRETNPLAVRLSDGVKFIDQITAEIKSVQTALAGFSDRVRLVDNQGKQIEITEMTTPTAIGNGSATVTTSGTAVPLSSTSIACRRVIVVAKAANTGTIWVGGSSVAVDSGVPLVGQQSEIFNIDDVSKLYIDASANSQGVTYSYEA